MDDKKADEVSEGLSLGATGKFPTGKKVRPDDKGELKSAIFEENEMVVITFGKAVKWVSMTPDDALNMAMILVERAMGIKNRQ